MAAGLPTVAFAEAIRGTDARPGEHVLLADKEERELSNALGSLAADRQRATGVADAARELVERRYDWAAIAADLEQTLAGLAIDGGRERAAVPAVS